MEEALKNYLKTVETALAALADMSADRDRVRLWLAWHLSQVQAFQHERFIHLIVTLFFAFLLLAAFIGTTVYPGWQFLALDVLLLILLLFYIKHYFFLENNVQRLYLLTERFYRLLGMKP